MIYNVQNHWVRVCLNQSGLLRCHKPTTGWSERPNMCSPVLLQYHSRTYWDHGHTDAHGCEHSVGHRAALMGQPDAVVVAEESSLVRREGRFVQKRSNKQHCMVGHTRADVKEPHQWTLSTGRQTEKQTKTEIIQSDSNVLKLFISFCFQSGHWGFHIRDSPNKRYHICWNEWKNQSYAIVLDLSEPFVLKIASTDRQQAELVLKWLDVSC